MIRKPDADWGRESAAVTTIRSAATGSVAAARAGTLYVRGFVCYGFAVLWGFAALGGGIVGGSLPTLVGVGAMSAGMWWWGKRLFARARA